MVKSFPSHQPRKPPDMSPTSNPSSLIVNYDPDHYLPVELLDRQWKMAKLSVGEVKGHPEIRHIKRGEVGVLLDIIAPSSMMISITAFYLLSLSNTGLLSWIFLSSFLFFAAVMVKKIRYFAKKKNEVDFAVLETFRIYLHRRYGFAPEGWMERFIAYVNDEEVPENRFSTDYMLTVRTIKGHAVFMVCNVDGEAPLSSEKNS